MTDDLENTSRRLLNALEHVISYNADDPWAQSIIEECKLASAEFVGALTNLKKSSNECIQDTTVPAADMLYMMSDCAGNLSSDSDHPFLMRWEDYWHAEYIITPTNTR